MAKSYPQGQLVLADSYVAPVRANLLLDTSEFVTSFESRSVLVTTSENQQLVDCRRTLLDVPSGSVSGIAEASFAKFLLQCPGGKGPNHELSHNAPYGATGRALTA